MGKYKTITRYFKPDKHLPNQKNFVCLTTTLKNTIYQKIIWKYKFCSTPQRIN
jgi:hypothetical protein